MGDVGALVEMECERCVLCPEVPLSPFVSVLGRACDVSGMNSGTLGHYGT